MKSRETLIRLKKFQVDEKRRKVAQIETMIAEFDRMAQINRGYREKFGFPCIVALKLHGARDTVVAEMERRLANGREAEIAAALEQIAHIARSRLEQLLKGN